MLIIDPIITNYFPHGVIVFSFNMGLVIFVITTASGVIKILFFTVVFEEPIYKLKSIIKVNGEEGERKLFLENMKGSHNLFIGFLEEDLLLIPVGCNVKNVKSFSVDTQQTHPTVKYTIHLSMSWLCVFNISKMGSDGDETFQKW